MRSKFKDGETVIVNGIGECDNTEYSNRKAVVICRNPHFLDYNIVFDDGTEDWIQWEFLMKG